MSEPAETSTPPALELAAPQRHERYASETPSLWQLRVFDTVARYENVTQAAHELLRSQPAVTSSLAELEAMLGVPLFERSTTGTYLTPEGMTALLRARRILELAEEAVPALGSTRGMPARTLVSDITRAQLRALLAIDECGSFRAAARMLGVTEASLQRAARTLEQHLGGELYKRSAAGVKATPVAREFAARLKAVHRQMLALVETMHIREAPKQPTVTCGVLILDPATLIAGAISELEKEFPECRVAIVNGTYENLLNKLLRGELDFILGVLKHPDRSFDFVEEPLYREHYCVVARKGHPLTQRGPTSLQALKDYAFVLPPRGAPRREAYERLFPAGSQPALRIETHSLSTIRITVADTDMLTMLSSTEVLNEQRMGLLEALPLELHLEGPVAGITTRREWEPNSVQAAFLASLRRRAAALSSSTLDEPRPGTPRA